VGLRNFRPKKYFEKKDAPDDEEDDDNNNNDGKKEKDDKNNKGVDCEEIMKACRSEAAKSKKILPVSVNLRNTDAPTDHDHEYPFRSVLKYRPKGIGCHVWHQGIGNFGRHIVNMVSKEGMWESLLRWREHERLDLAPANWKHFDQHNASASSKYPSKSKLLVPQVQEEVLTAEESELAEVVDMVCGSVPLGSLDSLLATSLTSALQTKYNISELPVLLVLTSRNYGDLLAHIQKRQDLEAKENKVERSMSGDKYYGEGGFEWWNGIRKRWTCPSEWIFSIDLENGEKFDVQKFRQAVYQLVERHPALRALPDDNGEHCQLSGEGAALCNYFWPHLGLPEFIVNTMRWATWSCFGRIKGLPASSQTIRFWTEDVVSEQHLLERIDDNYTDYQTTVWKDCDFTRVCIFTASGKGWEKSQQGKQWFHFLSTHAIIDGSSVSTIASDLNDLYHGKKLPPLRCMWGSLAKRQRESVFGYQFQNATDLHDFMLRAKYRLNRRFPLFLSANTTRFLKGIAKQHGVPVETLLFCIYALATARKMKVDFFPLALAVANRDGPQEQQMVGMFFGYRQFLMPTGEDMTVVGVLHWLHQAMRSREGTHLTPHYDLPQYTSGIPDKSSHHFNSRLPDPKSWPGGPMAGGNGPANRFHMNFVPMHKVLLFVFPCAFVFLIRCVGQNGAWPSHLASRKAASAIVR